MALFLADAGAEAPRWTPGWASPTPPAKLAKWPPAAASNADTRSTKAPNTSGSGFSDDVAQALVLAAPAIVPALGGTCTNARALHTLLMTYFKLGHPDTERLLSESLK